MRAEQTGPMETILATLPPEHLITLMRDATVALFEKGVTVAISGADHAAV